MSVRLALITVIQTQTVPTPWDRLPVPAKLVTKVMECHVQVGRDHSKRWSTMCTRVNQNTHGNYTQDTGLYMSFAYGDTCLHVRSLYRYRCIISFTAAAMASPTANHLTVCSSYLYMIERLVHTARVYAASLDRLAMHIE